VQWRFHFKETAMDHTQDHRSHRSGWRTDSPLAPYIDAFADHLTERGYAQGTIDGYVSGVVHFARWAHHRRLSVRRIDEATITQFLREHLPRCNCVGLARCDLRGLHAGLAHLLSVLRALGVADPARTQTNPVERELRRFDEYMDHVRGLAVTTRSMTVRIVRRLLAQRFGDDAVDIAGITPEYVRRFFAQQSKLYSKPVNTGAVTAALRGYFRYRATRGDAVHGLVGAVSYPANWQLAALPKALTVEEVEQLTNSLRQRGRFGWRADAIVRCALDLGLRSGEIAKLSLDDIDWRTGTITLRHTKSRREDVLPLPAATGEAIAAYLQHERPKTHNRAVFVRRLAPSDTAIGPDAVRKTIRQAYARAGLPHTRSHLLRHTMASRLLEGGSSLKEVADVLRHRSLNTTLIYAKLDSRNLREVALPWPGSQA
jgi:integrase/recombinase XerC